MGDRSGCVCPRNRRGEIGISIVDVRVVRDFSPFVWPCREIGQIHRNLADTFAVVCAFSDTRIDMTSGRVEQGSRKNTWTFQAHAAVTKRAD